MQRKNSFLRTSIPKQRSAIAMIMAIAVIIIITTIMAITLSLTAQTTKRTTDVYLYEQAVLISKSVAELTLLDIAQNTSCGLNYNNLNYRFDLNGDGNTADDIYDVNVTLRHVYTNPSPCAANNYFLITTPQESGSVLMDITVSTDVGTEPIRYFKRTIQKL